MKNGDASFLRQSSLLKRRGSNCRNLNLWLTKSQEEIHLIDPVDHLQNVDSVDDGSSARKENAKKYYEAKIICFEKHINALVP